MSLFLLFDWALATEKIILVSVVFAITLGVAAYSTWGERKVAAFMQDRMGPSRAGWGGILQPIADGVKMFTKEDFMPNQAERWLYILAPGAFMFVAAMTSAVIPWGTELTIFDKPVSLQVADLNIGILISIRSTVPFAPARK